jgi:glycosyltransferase involved in cell wall biosynthesis
MGRNGRAAVEQHFNWANEERKLLQLYEDILI